MSESVRVRFAPSPTGYLHIGGARTALFNYLFARSRGGEFLLRIEDTDLERSSAEMVDRILEGMSWLGLDPDEQPVIQSDHRAEHTAAAEKMLAEGNAYRCFCSKEELDEERRKAESEGRIYRYSGRCRDLSSAEIEASLEKGIPYTVRLRVPRDGVTRFKDLVYKNIEVKNSELDDLIIVRSDGSPVYQLAVVVDDARMGITHVIRGEDHLSNTPKQILIYLALGFPVPRFGHLPLILGPDGKRLSKRAGATSVEEFRDMGFIPEGVINSLALLGWSHPKNDTVFDLETLIREFDIGRINKKGAIFDLNKMIWINGQHISRLPAETLYDEVTGLWEANGFISASDRQVHRDRLMKAVELLKQRMRLSREFSEYGSYLFRAPDTFAEEDTRKYWSDPQLPVLMSDLQSRFASLETFNAETAEDALRSICDEMGVKAAVLIHALRLTVTGFTVSPDIFQLLEFLGREEILPRLKYAVSILPEKV